MSRAGRSRIPLGQRFVESGRLQNKIFSRWTFYAIRSTGNVTLHFAYESWNVSPIHSDTFCVLGSDHSHSGKTLRIFSCAPSMKLGNGFLVFDSLDREG